MKRILLISYFFEPFEGVGAKRLSYWASAFQAEKESVDCSVITATPQIVQKKNIVFIEDPNTWTNKLIFGASWLRPLKHHLQNRKDSFDQVLISGGPFGHFAIVRFLKKQFNCKVILDFRDPFSGNIRFGTPTLVEWVKKSLERRVLAQADHIITVNECCKDLLMKSAPEEKISIVENGYDEKIVDALTVKKIADGKLHIVHAGKFYSSIMPFAAALTEWNAKNPRKQFIFHHLGNENKELSSLNSEWIIQYGPKSYADTIEIMKKCAIGFLMTSGRFLEYNTKIFDYIGADLDIFIVTEGEIERGCIHGLTKKLGGKVTWSRAGSSDIQKFFAGFQPSAAIFPSKSNYTRRAGFLLLKKILETKPG